MHRGGAFSHGLFSKTTPLLEHFYSPSSKTPLQLKTRSSLYDSSGGLLTNLNVQTSAITPEIRNSLSGWTHSCSRLATQFFEGFPTEYQKILYTHVNEFALRASFDPKYFIQQEQIYRGTLMKYIHELQSKNGVSFTTLLEPAPTLQKLKPYELISYKNQFPEDTYITLNPVTSWTLYNLTKETDILKLGDAYIDTLNFDIIFICQNANKPHSWGAMIGDLSHIPEEKEILIPHGSILKIIKGEYFF